MKTHKCRVQKIFYISVNWYKRLGNLEKDGRRVKERWKGRKYMPGVLKRQGRKSGVKNDTAEFVWFVCKCQCAYAFVTNISKSV